jgi:tetratricopeptide (TPR) repeat protein
MPDTVTFAAGKTSISTLATLVLLTALEAAAQHPDPGAPPGSHDPLGAHAAVVGSVRPDAPRWREFRLRYEEALASGQYGEAEIAAKQMIDYMLGSGGPVQHSMVDALVDLAFAQEKRELYEAALANYAAAIDLLESGDNRLSAGLVTPLRGLGDTYMASGRADLALPAYERALHIRHVNDGPHSLDQVEILDAIVAAEMESGNPDAALFIVDRVQALHARAFAPDSVEVLPALQRKAGLLHELGRYRQERIVYRDIVKIIEDRRGKTDLSLLEPYRAMARTYFHELDEVTFRSEPTTETGETFLKKALAVSETNPGATLLTQGQILIQLGDYYTVRGVHDQARIQFRRAWDLMSSDPGYLDERARDLERVVPLVRTKLDRYADFGYRSRDDDAEPGDYSDGYVVATFTVNDRGYVTNVEIADAQPAGFASMEARVAHAVRDFIYRPRHEDAQPVHTPGQLFRHDYLYRESDLPASSP